MVMEHSDLLGSDNMSSYISNIRRDGFAVIENVVDAETIAQLLAELRNMKAGGAFSQRAGKAFGIRNLLNVMPPVRALGNSTPVRALVEPVLGREARVVRCIYFDKHRDANWKVAWHQDLTIAVSRQIETEGYGSWSVKANIPHVQPPLAVLEDMLALRIHLDDTDEFNGALRVIPGSHEHGRLSAQDIQSWKVRHTATTCPVKKGGVMIMRPLLLHASSAASHPRHRRVLHFEYSSASLPRGIEWYET